MTTLIRRGTKVALDGITLIAGELGLATDTMEVYTGDGANNYLIGRVSIGLLSARPTASQSGRIYYATDELMTYLDNGIAWVQVAAGTITAGSGLVKTSSELSVVVDGTSIKITDNYLHTYLVDGGSF